MAEGTSLLRMHTAYTCIVGSNPTVSARTNKKASLAGGFFIVWTLKKRPSLRAISLKLKNLPICRNAHAVRDAM